MITKGYSLNFCKYYIFEFKQQVNMKSNLTFFMILYDFIDFVFFSNGSLHQKHLTCFFVTHEDVNTMIACSLYVLLSIFAW